MVRGSLQEKAESWCLKNGIIVYPEPIDNQTLRLVVVNKGKQKKGKIIFKSKDIGKDDLKWWESINTIKIKYYEKNKR